MSKCPGCKADLEFDTCPADCGNEAMKKEVRFIQIQASPIENVQETQTVLMLYGLDADGVVWSKRIQDTEWRRESMLIRPEALQQEGKSND